MKRYSLLLVCLSLIGAAFCTLPSRLEIGRRNDAPLGWKNVGKAPLHEVLSFSILLKQKNLDKLDEVFADVSNPKSANWGNFLSQGEIQELVSPDRDVIESFVEWLKPLRHQAMVEVKGDYIRVTTTVLVASKLFQVPFFVFENEVLGKTTIRYIGSATVPAHLHKHIDFVAGLSEFFIYGVTKQISSSVAQFDLKRPQPIVRPRNVKDDPVITPSLLKQFYNVPANLVGTNVNNLQGVAAFTDYFSMGALEAFSQDQNLPAPNVTRIGPDCFPNCDQYESDLDIQYITGMGVGVPSVFLNQPANYWILQFAHDAQDMAIPPKIFSVSYGWSELEQCQVASINCAILGYNSIQYVKRTNSELQKLGALGISVLVSDGDDGAPSLGGATGNCPLDLTHWCPTGGCSQSSSSCGSITIVNNTNNLMCFFPMGLGSDACQVILQDNNTNNALEAFLEQNSNCQVTIDYDYSQMPHVYSACECSQLQSASVSGYTIEPYTYSPQNGNLFVADYPTSSPFVTSVGATQFLSNNGQLTEVACSILTGAIITTGGGFSSYQPMPDYQKTIVATYVAKNAGSLPPSYAYNANMRAYPDIAFNGHHYKVFFSNNTSDECPCPATEVDGTSCSSPALSGLLSLINDQLLNSGKTSLGFLNYLLYQMYSELPSAFNDVTSGNNNCNRAYCCQYGYSAVPGYDVVSGLGSPNFSVMLNYILQHKGVRV